VTFAEQRALEEEGGELANVLIVEVSDRSEALVRFGGYFEPEILAV
jgi:hypothetical protein